MSAENVLAYVEHTLMPMLNHDRVLAILAEARKVDGVEANHRAHRAAIMAGIEADAVRYSERLRARAWSSIWDGTQVEAWEISWVLARLGMGIATLDLVGNEGYSIEDYIALVQPWVSGFPEFPLPVKEDA